MVNAFTDEVYFAVAGVVIVAAGIIPIVKRLGWHNFHTKIWPGGANLEKTSDPQLFENYCQQLAAFGFRLVGEYQECGLLETNRVEQAFVHDELQCRAAVFSVLGSGPKICVTSEFENGFFVKVLNFSGDDLDESLLIQRRVPTHSVKRILLEHHQARASLIESGMKLVCFRTLEQWQASEERAFHHPVTQALYRKCQLLIGLCSMFNVFITAFCFGLVGEVMLGCTYAQAFLIITCISIPLGWCQQRLRVAKSLREAKQEQDLDPPPIIADLERNVMEPRLEMPAALEPGSEVVNA